MAWPSGKAEACKAFIPSSNLGATFSLNVTNLMLYIVATPIGNLSDFTFRAIETLKKSDYILCEDTRHSRTLLEHYQIEKKLVSFHKFNENYKETQVLQDLQNGQIISLISDAGTPGISDPGEHLIHSCIENNIAVTPIPGCCAAITALSASGLDTTLFQFIGFLPKKAGELKKLMQGILPYRGSSICYESPNRLISVLELIEELEPDRPLVVARELTKKFEEIKRGTARELLEKWKKTPLKGEIVLIVSKNMKGPSKDWETLSPEEHVEFLQQEYSLSKREAIVNVAKIRGVSKRDIYNKLL